MSSGGRGLSIETTSQSITGEVSPNTVHKIAGNDFGPRINPEGEAQERAESNLPTSFIEAASLKIRRSI